MLTKSGAEEAGFCCPQIEHEECFATRLCKLDTIMNVLDTYTCGWSAPRKLQGFTGPRPFGFLNPDCLGL